MATKKDKNALSGKQRRSFRPTKIRLWREARGLSQEQLAELVGNYLNENGIAKGYTHATIGRLENGKVGYTQHIMEALAHVLRTDVGSLILRDPPEKIWLAVEKAPESIRSDVAEIAAIILKKVAHR